jgi:hypothetical protein
MTGTVMERSHAKLTQWAMAFYLAASSKKGFSAKQLERALGCEYNTAWFLHHRVMEAMRRGGLDVPSMGEGGGPVEVDETYLGRVKGTRVRRGAFSTVKADRSVASISLLPRPIRSPRLPAPISLRKRGS